MLYEYRTLQNPKDFQQINIGTCLILLTRTDHEYNIRSDNFCVVVCMEKGPLCLVSTTEVLLGRSGSGSCLESQEYDRGNRYADQATPSIHKTLALTSPTSGCRTV
jgi:hypothetical protein